VDKTSISAMKPDGSEMAWYKECVH